MGTKLVNMRIDEELLAQIDAAAEAAQDGKKRGRTEFILEAVQSRLADTPQPRNKRLAAIVDAYEQLNPQGQRYLALCAELSLSHKEFIA